MKDFLKIVLIAFSVYFLSWVVVYFSGVNKLAIQSEDTIPAIFLPVTIVKEGTPYVDSYYDMVLDRYPHPDDKGYSKEFTPFYFKKVSPDKLKTFEIRRVKAQTLLISYENENYHYISAFPLITGILAIPIYLVPLLVGVPINWESLAVLSHASAALIMALAGGFMYLLLKDGFALKKKKSELITYLFLFATINYALISQALWQHGTLQLLVILSLYYLFKFINADDKSSDKSLLNIYLSGLFFGFAFLSRPTAALFLVPLFLLLYQATWRDYKKLLASLTLYFLGIVPAILFFVWYNFKYYFAFNNQGYATQATVGWLSNLPEGFLGLWISPSKGMLVYSPVLLFSIVGAILVIRRLIKYKTWDENLKYVVFMIIILLETLVLGKWKHWYGGWSYGYRMASDVLPFMVLLIVPYVTSQKYNKSKVFFYVLFGLSILIQVHGIVFFDGVWHAAYDQGFRETSWLWSLRDSEFAFNFRRILVKFGLLEKACPQCASAILPPKCGFGMLPLN